MVNDVRLQNFRSYKDESFEFSERVNVIVGPNASGKTNLMEAILFLCQAKSYRAKEADIIQHNQAWARLDAHTKKETRTIKLIREDDRVNKLITINSKEIKRMSKNSVLPVVLFEPENLRMLSGSPQKRREFLDEILDKTIEGYSALRKKYQRALFQRNTLLKKSSLSKELLFPWNVRLSDIGGSIARHRSNLIEIINNNVAEHYSKISNKKTKVAINYKSELPLTDYNTQLLRKLESTMSEDCNKGFTSCGPHRDDISIKINDYTLQDNASRGEVRTMVLALKIIELMLIEKQSKEKPVLLLDDVFSELDGLRRRSLMDYINDYQTFITTTDADAVVEHFLEGVNVIPLSRY